MKDWHTKPPSSVRSVDDAMHRAGIKRGDLPHTIQVYASDWDIVILSDEIERLQAENAKLKKHEEAARRPDPLGEALNTGDGSYRP